MTRMASFLTPARAPALLAVPLLAVACSDQGPQPAQLVELDRHERLWQEARPASYAFSVERLCFCGAEARGPVRVQVEGSSVVSRAYVGSGTEVPEVFAELFPSVDGLFDILREAITSGAFRIDVTYDPETGVPLTFWIDYQASVADEELGMTVTEGIEATPAHL